MPRIQTPQHLIPYLLPPPYWYDGSARLVHILYHGSWPWLGQPPCSQHERPLGPGKRDCPWCTSSTPSSLMVFSTGCGIPSGSPCGVRLPYNTTLITNISCATPHDLDGRMDRTGTSTIGSGSLPFARHGCALPCLAPTRLREGGHRGLSRMRGDASSAGLCCSITCRSTGSRVLCISTATARSLSLLTSCTWRCTDATSLSTVGLRPC